MPYGEQALFVIQIDGAAGLELALSRMEPKVVKRITRRALKAAGAPMLAAAKANVPVSEHGSHGHLPGHLWRHVELFAARAPGKGSYSVGVGIRGMKTSVSDYAFEGKDQPYYAPFVELGHMTGKRKVWHGKWSTRQGGRKVMESRVDRGFVAAQPFLRDAFDATKDEAAQILSAEIMSEIEAVWEREGSSFVGAFGPGGMSRRRASTVA